jgi:hypothetical protein
VYITVKIIYKDDNYNKVELMNMTKDLPFTGELLTMLTGDGASRFHLTLLI